MRERGDDMEWDALERRADSYGSWLFGHQCWREREIRAGNLEPVFPHEHAWKAAGPIAEGEHLDTVRPG